MYRFKNNDASWFYIQMGTLSQSLRIQEPLDLRDEETSDCSSDWITCNNTNTVTDPLLARQYFIFTDLLSDWVSEPQKAASSSDGFSMVLRVLEPLWGEKQQENLIVNNQRAFRIRLVQHSAHIQFETYYFLPNGGFNTHLCIFHTESKMYIILF